jgi:hypothetical protein
VSPGGAADDDLSLFNAVLDPVIAHAHSLGPFLENGFFAMPSLASWGWPISFSVSRVTVPVLALTNRAPYSASATEETTCLPYAPCYS